MQIIINETGAVESLSIIDPKSGTNYIADFVGNTGALHDGQFAWDDDAQAHRCDQDTYDWWATVVAENQSLDDRKHALAQEHGWEAVHEALAQVGHCELEDQACQCSAALDEAFGA
jgi:hypothetical protein